MRGFVSLGLGVLFGYLLVGVVSYGDEPGDLILCYVSAGAVGAMIECDSMNAGVSAFIFWPVRLCAAIGRWIDELMGCIESGQSGQ
jgi:hypothetical protein